jgi:hypothetical protein
VYKKAIDLLIGMGNVEKEKLAVELAKHHPSIFTKLVEGKGKEEEVMLDNNIVFIINALNAGIRVDAVKGIRDYFGHSLLASLDIVKAYDGDKDIFLSHAQTATLNNLNRVAKVLKG